MTTAELLNRLADLVKDSGQCVGVGGKNVEPGATRTVTIIPSGRKYFATTLRSAIESAILHETTRMAQHQAHLISVYVQP